MGQPVENPIFLYQLRLLIGSGFRPVKLQNSLPSTIFPPLMQAFLQEALAERLALGRLPRLPDTLVMSMHLLAGAVLPSQAVFSLENRR